MQALFTQLVVGLVLLLSGCTVSLYITPHSTVLSTTAAAPEVVAVPEAPPAEKPDDPKPKHQKTTSPVTAPEPPEVAKPCKLEPLPYRSPIPEPLALRNPEVVDADQVNSVLVEHILALRKFINAERTAVKSFYIKQQRLCQQ